MLRISGSYNNCNVKLLDALVTNLPERNVKLLDWSRNGDYYLNSARDRCQIVTMWNYNHMEDSYWTAPTQKKPMMGYMNSFIVKKKMCSITSISQIKPFSIIKCSMLLSKVKGCNNQGSSKFIDNWAGKQKKKKKKSREVGRGRGQGWGGVDLESDSIWEVPNNIPLLYILSWFNHCRPIVSSATIIGTRQEHTMACRLNVHDPATCRKFILQTCF